MTYLCGSGLPDFDWPDAGKGSCCWGATGGPRDCTCWTPVYDLDQVPALAGAEGGLRTEMCGDCAYRPGSPERAGDPAVAGDGELLDRIVATGERFWCHQGIRRITHYVHTPTGVTYVPPVGLDAAYDRSLEAERLRPVPPPPDTVPRAHPRPVDELDARRARRKAAPDKDAGIKALRAAGELYRAKQAQRGETD